MLSSKGQQSYVPTCDPWGGASFYLMGYQMNKLGRSPLGDATYKISKLYAFHFQRRRIPKFVFFVPMLELVNPTAGPVLTQGVRMNKLGRGPQGDAIYICNIKSLRHPVSEKKNFEDGLLCSMFKLVTHTPPPPPPGRGKF